MGHPWYVLLDGSAGDEIALKQLFATSGFSFEEIDSKFALSSPEFKKHPPGDYNAVLNDGAELLAKVNVALRLSRPGCKGFELSGIAEKREGKTHRVMLASGLAYGIGGAAAVARADSFGKPVRSREERLVGSQSPRGPGQR
jgi:hypothetical protein